MKLNKETINKTVKEYYDKGVLTVQAPSKPDRSCYYSVSCDDGLARFCAIGACFDKLGLFDRVLTTLTNNNSIMFLGDELVQEIFETKSDYEYAVKLQGAYDSYCIASKLSWENEISYKKEFLEYINNG